MRSPPAAALLLASLAFARGQQVVCPDFRFEKLKVAHDEDAVQSVTFSAIGKVGTVPVDLQVLPAGSTWKSEIARNKVQQGIGAINGVAGVRHSLMFRVVASGTTMPVKVPILALTIFGIESAQDESGKQLPEVLQVNGVSGQGLPSNRGYDVNVQDNSLTLTSTTAGTAGSIPVQADQITQSQIALAATVYFVQNSGFTLDMDFSKVPSRSSQTSRSIYIVPTCFIPAAAPLTPIPAGSTTSAPALTVTTPTASTPPTTPSPCQCGAPCMAQGGVAGRYDLSCDCETDVGKLAQLCKVAALPDFTFSTVQEKRVADTVQAVTFPKIGHLGGIPVDLQVAPSPGSPWKASSPNTVVGGLAKLNFLEGSAYNITFRIVVQGTSNPVVAPLLGMTIYDIDSDTDSKGNQVPEIIRLSGFTQYALPKGKAYDANANGRILVLTSTTIGSEADDPKGTESLTASQSSMAATAYYAKTSTFSVVFDISKMTQGRSRNFYIAFKGLVPPGNAMDATTAVLGPTEASCPNLQLTTAKVVAEDQTVKSLIIPNIGAWGTKPIDLKVLPSKGSVWKAEAGSIKVENGIGQINVLVPGKYTFTFSTVVAGTDVPVVMPMLSFVLLDIDSGSDENGNQQPEGFTLHGFSSYSLPPDRAFDAQELSGSLQLTSTTIGDKTNTPTAESSTLTELQNQLSATIFYDRVSNFSVTFDVTKVQAKDEPGGRSFSFMLKCLPLPATGWALRRELSATVSVPAPTTAPTKGIVITTLTGPAPAPADPVPALTVAPQLPQVAPTPLASSIPTPAPSPEPNIPFKVSSRRTCRGTQEDTQPCPDLPACNRCEPRDCAWSDWSDWVSMGVCWGLCQRSRRISVPSNECGRSCKGPYQVTKTCTSDPEWREHCAVDKEDCVLSAWSDWSTCSNSRGGQSYREREVKQPPRNNGTSCQAPLKETKFCGEKLAARDCEFNVWKDWSDCSSSCGVGQRWRLRTIKREAAAGGTPCNGSLWDRYVCNTDPCTAKAACAFEDWSPWQGCTFLGDKQVGQTTRTRALKPSLGEGAACSGDLRQTTVCTAKDVDTGEKCLLSDWGDWQACDRTCNGGQSWRLRHVVKVADDCGNCNAATTKQVKACENIPCEGTQTKTDCELGAWRSWSECSAPCGPGVKFRARKVDREAQAGGQSCEGGLKQVSPCMEKECDSPDCKWGDWSFWSGCSKTCGGGTKRRDRVIEVSPRDGGKLCEEKDKSEVGACSTEPCEGTCIDGAWGNWSDWGRCSASCGMGIRKRTREVVRPPNFCGNPAVGLSEEYERCPDQPSCVEDQDCEFSEWVDWSDCSSSCYGVRERQRTIKRFPIGNGTLCSLNSVRDMEPCNPGPDTAPPSSCGEMIARQDCILSDWLEWDRCPVTCGGSQHTRTRDVVAHAEHGGEPCTGPMEETAACGTATCTGKCKDCLWGDWSSWSGCGRCGGQQTRHRSIAQLGNYCGKQCDTGAAKQVNDCPSSAESCAEERWCVWSDWQTFHPCENRCGASALRQRTLRAAADEPDEYVTKGGKDIICSGTQMESHACDVPKDECEDKCARLGEQPCVWGTWSDWTSPSCVGLCERHRVVKIKNNECSPPCVGPTVTTKVCEANCTARKDCEMSDWGQWSTCDAGQLQSFRGRKVTQYPKNSGAACIGRLNETRSCDRDVSGPQNCSMNEWSSWSSCSKTCDGGFQLRHREVTTHAANGGEACSAPVQEMQPCSEQCCGAHEEKSDCKLSPWGEWGACDDGDQRYRTREIEKYPKFGGVPCNMSILKSTKACGAEACKVSRFESWGPCSKDCGGGQKTFHRDIVREPKRIDWNNPIEACPRSRMKTEPCNKDPCNPVNVTDCELGAWQDWGMCSASCGAGFRQRSRAIETEASGGGLGCVGNLTAIEPCASVVCNITNCSWHEWQDWNSCTRTCAGGTRQRFRQTAHRAGPGGLPCAPHTKHEIEPCNSELLCSGGQCTDGRWGVWEEWGKCSRTCDGGLQTRTRDVEQEANFCGNPAVGVASETRGCDADVPCVWPRNCTFGPWSEWNDCQVFNLDTCQGWRERSRTIKAYRLGRGEFCKGSLREHTFCKDDTFYKNKGGCPRPDDVIDCTLSEWSEWSNCSDECEDSQKFKSRKIMVPPSNGGKPCEDALNMTTKCPKQKDCRENKPIDCKWGEWQDWDACYDCHHQRDRHRLVEVPPMYGGKNCDTRSDVETSSCKDVCDDGGNGGGSSEVWCTWEDWGTWGDCSLTCGPGIRYRSRNLKIVEAPSDDHELYDVEALRKKIFELDDLAKSGRTRQIQEVVVAFSCGMLSLVFLLGIGRICGRSFAGARGAGVYRAAEDMPLGPMPGGADAMRVDVE